MPESATEAVGVAHAEPLESLWRRRVRALRRRDIVWWQVGVGAVGVAAATAAVVVTLRASFLAYPGWLALQKADFIIGPIGIGLYWYRRRPASRFGPLLIAVGLLHIPYIAESSANPVLFTIGLYWEAVVFLTVYALILTFPSGRWRWWPEGLFLLVAAFGPDAIATTTALLTSQVVPGGTISACRAACPKNLLVITEDPQLALSLQPYARWMTIAVATATAALLVWRLAAGSPPQRRALAIGTPIALVFLASQVLNQLARMYGSPDSDFLNYMRWTIVVTRALVWYGFLAALIAAELFAGRVLRQMVGESLRRPSLRELEELLRRPLGDPGLQLAFWRPRTREWRDGDSRLVQPPSPESGQVLTEVRREGDPAAAAIVHDIQLADDPELLRAAAATTLLALENAVLEEAWMESLRELTDSRARIATVADEERRRLERDLHDGAQQGLLAVRVSLMLAADQATEDEAHRARLSSIVEQLDDAINELRDLAHGIYPPVLAEHGLARALEAATALPGREIKLASAGIGRYPSEIETGIYYCCREALQNAIKHARATRISIRLEDDGNDLTFEIRDDGVGFGEVAEDSAGLQNMRDRVAVLGGRIELLSTPGLGTRVAGAVPLRWPRGSYPSPARDVAL